MNRVAIHSEKNYSRFSGRVKKYSLTKNTDSRLLTWGWDSQLERVGSKTIPLTILTHFSQLFVFRYPNLLTNLNLFSIFSWNSPLFLLPKVWFEAFLIILKDMNLCQKNHWSRVVVANVTEQKKDTPVDGTDWRICDVNVSSYPILTIKQHPLQYRCAESRRRLCKLPFVA